VRWCGARRCKGATRQPRFFFSKPSAVRKRFTPSKEPGENTASPTRALRLSKGTLRGRQGGCQLDPPPRKAWGRPLETRCLDVTPQDKAVKLGASRRGDWPWQLPVFANSTPATSPRRPPDLELGRDRERREHPLRIHALIRHAHIGSCLGGGDEGEQPALVSAFEALVKDQVLKARANPLPPRQHKNPREPQKDLAIWLRPI
jgi:hypothetical protein